MSRDSAERLERDDVVVTHDLAVWRFVLNDLLTNGFVVRPTDSDALAIVDPGGRPDDLLAAAGELGGNVCWILVTHLHGDHWAALEAVREATGARVVSPSGAPFHVDRPVSGGEELDLDAAQILVAATPGHSPESVSYQIGRNVFVGDFLFRLGSGRTDGARASTRDLFETVCRVFVELPDETILWCGHGPPSTVGEEKAGNPFWAVARHGLPATPAGHATWRGETVPVWVWADDYDGGRKALVGPAGDLVIVPGSQLSDGG